MSLPHAPAPAAVGSPPPRPNEAGLLCALGPPRSVPVTDVLGAPARVTNCDIQLLVSASTSRQGMHQIKRTLYPLRL